GRLAVAGGSGPPLLSAAAVMRGFQRVGAAGRRGGGGGLGGPGVLGGRGGELLAPAFLEDLGRRRLPADRERHAHHDRSVNVARLVRRAGFEKVRTFWEGHETVLSSPEQFWEVQRTFSTVVRERLAHASADEVESLRNEVLTMDARVGASGGRAVYRH